MIQNFNFDYDPENGSLFLYSSNSKSKASVEMDDLIIDFNANKEITGIEFLNASEFLKDLDINDNKIDLKNFLSQINKCQVEIIQKENFFIIKLILISKSNQRLATPFLIPSINEPSPALAEI